MGEDEVSNADLGYAGVVRVGDLLSTGARAMGDALVPFFVITLLILSPYIVGEIVLSEWVSARLEELAGGGYYGHGGRQEIELVQSFGNLGLLLVQSACLFVAQAVLMHATVQYMAGRKTSVGASLAAGLSRIHIVLAVAILESVAIGLGTMFCIIPGVVLTCVLYASIPAAVVEDLNPIDALQRSAELTSGHRWTIFITIFILGAASFVLNIAVELSFGPSMEQPLVPAPMTQRIIHYVLSNVILVFVTMVQAAVAAVFYARVRGIRDNVDVNAIADVFR
jgi:hypothetical protein